MPRPFLFAIALAGLLHSAKADEQLPREPLLQELKTATVVRVADFGARPDDGQDDLPGIKKAVSKALGIADLLQRQHGRAEFRHPE